MRVSEAPDTGSIPVEATNPSSLPDCVSQAGILGEATLVLFYLATLLVVAQLIG